MFAVTAGMCLEANLREDFPNEIGLATVAKINEKGHLYLTFNTPDKTFDYWALIVDNNLHPVLYCSDRGQRLLGKKVFISYYSMY